MSGGRPQAVRSWFPVAVLPYLPLLLCRGHHNVVEFLDAFRIPSGGFGIVFPLVPHDDFLRIMERATVNDIRHYMRALLQALAHIHSQVCPACVA